MKHIFLSNFNIWYKHLSLNFKKMHIHYYLIGGHFMKFLLICWSLSTYVPSDLFSKHRFVDRVLTGYCIGSLMNDIKLFLHIWWQRLDINWKRVTLLFLGTNLSYMLLRLQVVWNTSSRIMANEFINIQFLHKPFNSRPDSVK